MLKPFSQELRSERLLTRSDRVVVGVSAGPDSMALLHLLLGLNRLDDWDLDLHIAHLNHQLRGADADADAAFVQAAADSHSIPCTIEKRDVAKLAEAESVGVEEFLFILEKFAGLGGAAGSGGLPIKARTDMLGVFAAPSPVLDGVISVGEISSLVDAFGGAGYPFVPSVSVLCP